MGGASSYEEAAKAATDVLTTLGASRAAGEPEESSWED
jgi:hypothetical protein